MVFLLKVVLENKFFILKKLLLFVFISLGLFSSLVSDFEKTKKKSI